MKVATISLCWVAAKPIKLLQTAKQSGFIVDYDNFFWLIVLDKTTSNDTQPTGHTYFDLKCLISCASQTWLICFEKFIHQSVCAYVRMWVCGHVRMCVCAYVRMCVCAYVRMWVCVYVRMLVCAYVRMCVCVYVGMWFCGYVGMWVCGSVGLRGHLQCASTNVHVIKFYINW